ncbi:hypothetical protein, partial [Pseudomonas agarici]
MKKLLALFVSLVITGCAAHRDVPQGRPYDNPKKGYVVYRPIAEIQRWDGPYLEGFRSSGAKYVSNCVSVNAQFNPSKIIASEMYYDHEDEVVYLTHDFGPRFIRCDINYEIIRSEAERYIAENKASSMAKIEEEIRRRNARAEGNKGRESTEKVEFGGFVATREDILTSVLLACYTGSLDSDDKWIPREEQAKRYKDLLGLYEGDAPKTKRITNAFNFARSNLSSRYPLDTMA